MATSANSKQTEKMNKSEPEKFMNPSPAQSKHEITKIMSKTMPAGPKPIVQLQPKESKFDPKTCSTPASTSEAYNISQNQLWQLADRCDAEFGSVMERLDGLETAQYKQGNELSQLMALIRTQQQDMYKHNAETNQQLAELNKKLSKQANRVEAALTKSEMELSSLHIQPSEAEQKMAQELEQMRILIEQQKEENAQLRSEEGPMGAEYQLLLKQKEIDILQKQLEHSRTQSEQNQHRGSSFRPAHGGDEPLQGPRPILPTFSGSSDDHFDVWRQTLEDHFTYLNWGQEYPKRIAIIPTLLKGYALMTYRALKPHQLRSYETIMQAMAERFSMQHKPATAVLARLSRKQGISESVAEYSTEIIKRIQECGVTETATQIDHFVSNLRPEIRSHVLMQMPKSLIQCQQHAEAFEYAHKVNGDTAVDAVKQKYKHYNRGRQSYRSNTKRTFYRSNSRTSNSRSPSADRKKTDNDDKSNYRRNQTPFNKQRKQVTALEAGDPPSETNSEESEEDLNC